MRKQRYNELMEHPERLNIGIQAVFNGDLHRQMPEWAPREDWRILSAVLIEHVSEPDECTPEELAELEERILESFADIRSP